MKFYQLLRFNQVCELNNTNGWIVVRDEWKGSYAYNRKEWIAFDDRDLIRNKAYSVREHNLLGVASDSLDSDDPNNRCGYGRFPMLALVHSILQFPRQPKLRDPTSKV